MPPPLANWAGNLTYAAARVHAPRGVDELADRVARASRLRVIGSRHCFNDIANTDADLIDTQHLSRILEINPHTRTVTIEPGVTYGHLGPALHDAGFALHNLASLPHINIAGATATATHGSGNALPSLAAAVRTITFIAADGNPRAYDRDTTPDTFPACPVHLGALGVVSQLTLDIEPTYGVVQHVYAGVTLDAMLQDFDTITGAATSVSLFTRWADPTQNQLWLKQRVDQPGTPRPPRLFGGTLAATKSHPIPGVDPTHCTTQGAPGPWHERLPHFRMDFTPSAGDELQAEYLIPRAHACDALQRVAAMSDRITPVLWTSEVRTIARDDLWLSPFHQSECVALHFTWKPDTPGVAALLPDLEAALAPFDARPHWGKLFAMGHNRLAALYPKLGDFKALAHKHDPTGKFANTFVRDKLWGENA